MTRSRVRIFAPASISNLGPGFDVLGLALERPGDVVDAERSDLPGVQIVAVDGGDGTLSTDAGENVTGVAAAHALQQVRSAFPDIAGTQGVRLWLHKQMPLASGLGSSGASSVAGAVAVNELFGRPLTRTEVLASAMEGERCASGSPHADNVAPTLYGGIVLIRSYHPLEVVELPAPPGLWVAVIHPHCKVSTAQARSLVAERTYTIDQVISNLGNLGAFVSALYRGDLALLGRAVHDELVEPVRAHLIPGFEAVKAQAMAAGALGCSIAGSGPSVFALCHESAIAERVATAMQEAFQTAGRLVSDRFVGKAGAPGARRLD